MGLSVITCLEIFANPKDLEINIIKDAGTNKFAILICRGPGHNYKAILTSLPFTNELDVAVETTKVIFEGAIEVGRNFSLEKGTKLPPVLDGLMTKIETSLVFNQDMLDKILLELRDRQTVSTHHFFKEYVLMN